MTNSIIDGEWRNRVKEREIYRERERERERDRGGMRDRQRKSNGISVL